MFPQGCGRLGTRAAGWVLSLGTAVSGVPLLCSQGDQPRAQRRGVLGQWLILGDKNTISVLIRGIVASSCARVISECMPASSERVSVFSPKPDLARERGKFC